MGVTQLPLWPNPASDWCQRWGPGRVARWRHRSDGGFDCGRYDVRAIGEAAARAYVIERHYSGTYPAARLRYGLFDAETDLLAGVIVLGIPVTGAVLARAFPDLEPYTESLDLARMVLDDGVAANGETWFLGQVFRLAGEAGIRGLTSFSDPLGRLDHRGHVVFPGHVGTVYQAANAVYTGRTQRRPLRMLPAGTVLSERALAKVRTQDRGHEYVERQLVAAGAAAPRAGQSPRDWLDQALAAAGVRTVVHPGMHRYCFRLGPPAERRSVRLGLVAEPYPKSLPPAA